MADCFICHSHILFLHAVNWQRTNVIKESNGYGKHVSFIVAPRIRHSPRKVFANENYVKIFYLLKQQKTRINRDERWIGQINPGTVLYTVHFCEVLYNKLYLILTSADRSLFPIPPPPKEEKKSRPCAPRPRPIAHTSAFHLQQAAPHHTTVHPKIKTAYPPATFLKSMNRVRSPQIVHGARSIHWRIT